jgi:hypothetical protein
MTNKLKEKSTSEGFPQELIDAIRYVYEPAGMKVTEEPRRELESSAYEACRFGLDHRTIVFRVAKITPTKIGQFVTLWKRPTANSEIAPFDSSDGIAFVVINVSDAKHRGQFVFDSKTLVAQGVMSQNGKGGKRAMRLYPPWTKPDSKVARKTQQWQLMHYLPLTGGDTVDTQKVHQLFNV